MTISFRPNVFNFFAEVRPHLAKGEKFEQFKEDINIMRVTMRGYVIELKEHKDQKEHEDLYPALIELLKVLKSSDAANYEAFSGELILLCQTRSDIAQKLLTKHYFELLNLLPRNYFRSLLHELKKNNDKNALIDKILVKNQGKPLSDEDGMGGNADVEFHQELLAKKRKVLQEKTDSIISNHLSKKNGKYSAHSV